MMNIKTARTITQGALLIAALLIPVFDIFRFDVVELKLYLFMQEWSFAPQGEYLSGAGGDPVDFIFKGIIPTLLLFVTLPVWGVVLGRFLCGWFCPVGAIFEIADFFRKKLTSFKRYRVDLRAGNGKSGRMEVFTGLLTVLILVIALLAAAVFGAALFVSPDRIWQEITSFAFSSLFLSVVLSMMALIIGTYFARITFCSYICLFGITQTIPFLVSPVSLRIRFSRERASMCTNCRGCERACFMGIKPRTMKKKVNPKCVNCGKCITACRRELGNKNGLFSYGFGAGKREVKKSLKEVSRNETAA